MWNFWVKDICIFNCNRCCHIAFPQNYINAYFQPKIYWSSNIPFSKKDCCSLIFPSNLCKLMSHCVILIAYEFEPLFIHVLLPGIAFLWIAHSYLCLSFLLCLSLIYLFCMSSLYIIAIHPLSDLWIASPLLLLSLVFICWPSLWSLSKQKLFILFGQICIYILYSFQVSNLD